MGNKLSRAFLTEVMVAAYDLGYFTDKLLAETLGVTQPRISRYVDAVVRLRFATCLGHAKVLGDWSAATGKWYRITTRSTKEYYDVLPRKIRAQSWRRRPELKRACIVCTGGEIVADHDAAVAISIAWIIRVLRSACSVGIEWSTAHRILTYRGLNPLLRADQARYLGIGEAIAGSPIPDIGIHLDHHSKPAFYVEVELNRKSADRYDRIISAALSESGLPRLYVLWDPSLQSQLVKIFSGYRSYIKIIKYGDSSALCAAVKEICQMFTFDPVI